MIEKWNDVWAGFFFIRFQLVWVRQAELGARRAVGRQHQEILLALWLAVVPALVELNVIDWHKPISSQLARGIQAALLFSLHCSTTLFFIVGLQVVLFWHNSKPGDHIVVVWLSVCLVAIGISPQPLGVKWKRRKQINTEKQLQWVDPRWSLSWWKQSESYSSSIGVSHG